MSVASPPGSSPSTHLKASTHDPVRLSQFPRAILTGGPPALHRAGRTGRVQCRLLLGSHRAVVGGARRIRLQLVVAWSGDAGDVPPLRLLQRAGLSLPS